MFEFESQSVDDNSKQFLWVEKYRPQEFDDYLGNEEMMNDIKLSIDKGQIMNLLFHSLSPGTGKSSIAKLIPKKLDCDCLYINAADETGIDTIRNKVTSFASTIGFGKLKVIILDESQRMSDAGQRALLNVMEQFSEHTRFILTCNNAEKIIGPLISRLTVYHVQPLSKGATAKHVAKILKNEGIEYSMEDLKKLFKYYPDIRRIINTAQKCSITGKLVVVDKNLIETDIGLKLVDILQKKIDPKEKVIGCRQLLADYHITSFEDMYLYLYNHIDEYAPTSIANTILALADYQDKDSRSANKEITFAACLLSIIGGIG